MAEKYFTEAINLRHKQIEIIYSAVAEVFEIDWRELYPQNNSWVSSKIAEIRVVLFLLFRRFISINEHTISEYTNFPIYVVSYSIHHHTLDVPENKYELCENIISTKLDLLKDRENKKAP